MNIPANRPAEPVEEQKEERKKAQRISFKPQHLIKPEGVKKLYNMGKAIKLKPNDDVGNLKKIVDTLKKWHYDLMFKYNFEFFMDRCQAFGTTKEVQNHMNKVRKIHKGQATWDEEEQPVPMVVEPNVQNVPAREPSIRSQSLNQQPRRQQNVPRPPEKESDDEEDQEVLQAMMKQLQRNIEQRDEIPEEEEQYQFGAVEYEEEELPQGFDD